MNVIVLTYSDYDDCHVVGVFSDEDKVKIAISNEIKNNPKFKEEQFFIESFEVN